MPDLPPAHWLTHEQLCAIDRYEGDALVKLSPRERAAVLNMAVFASLAAPICAEIVEAQVYGKGAVAVYQAVERLRCFLTGDMPGSNDWQRAVNASREKVDG